EDRLDRRDGLFRKCEHFSWDSLLPRGGSFHVLLAYPRSGYRNRSPARERAAPRSGSRVRLEGLEPPRAFAQCRLKPPCLPIPPQPRGDKEYSVPPIP